MKSRLSAAELAQAADPLIIALACAGDDQAFAEIMRRRHQRVRKFMYHVCRQSSLGDDLAQQVFLTAWRSLDQLRTAAAFDGWLKQIMIRTWLDEVRRRKLRVTEKEELEPESIGSYRDMAAEQLDLDAALAKLPPDVRLCLVLAYNEGMSHPEIARATSLPVGTVKSHISRGAARLRDMLADYQEIES